MELLAVDIGGTHARFAIAVACPVMGHVSLAQGAEAVIVAGGLGRRVADVLPRSGKAIIHLQPGLFGAAAAFAEEHGR